MNNSQGNDQGNSRYVAQIILSSLRFAQECFKVKLISKSHNRAITKRYGLAIELTVT